MFVSIPYKWIVINTFGIVGVIILGAIILFTEPPVVEQVQPEVAGIEAQNTHGTVPSGTDKVVVVEVVDGDTIKIQSVEGRKTLRLIGIDTPELHDPRKPVECYAQEAKSKLEGLLLNKEVYIAPDATQTNVDRYNRQLRYVWIADGQLVNKILVSEGYAFEYTYKVPYVFQNEFKLAEQQAQSQQKGLWSSKTCQGKR